VDNCSRTGERRQQQQQQHQYKKPSWNMTGSCINITSWAAVSCNNNSNSNNDSYRPCNLSGHPSCSRSLQDACQPPHHVGPAIKLLWLPSSRGQRTPPPGQQDTTQHCKVHHNQQCTGCRWTQAAQPAPPTSCCGTSLESHSPAKQEFPAALRTCVTSFGHKGIDGLNKGWALPPAGQQRF
jgi:hypothetical protein